MNKWFVCVVLFLFVGFRALAQDTQSATTQIISDIFEQYTAESEESIDYETFYENLIFLSKHKVNLNNCSKEDLAKMLFLSDIQIENILAYLYSYGPISTIYELQLIDGLDMTDIHRMLPFVETGKSEVKPRPLQLNEILKYGEHQLFIRAESDLEQKEGYMSNAGEIAYAGNPLYAGLKYRFDFSDRLHAGFTAEKDPGEAIFTSQNKGFDFNSGYVMLENTGKLKKLIAGDFKAGFGMGLVMQSGFGVGKSSYVMNVFPFNQGLTKSGSTDEFNFFRGIGATASLKELEISAFYSNRMLDADTAGGDFSSFYKTGLHRTTTEMQKKQTVNQQVAGGNITYNKNNFRIGLTAVYSYFNLPLIPEDAHYNVFRFRGNSQLCGGVNYRFRWQKLNFFGETATTNGQNIATLNGIMFSPLSTVSVVLLQRYYPKNYDAFFANAFSESTRTNNESGFYIGTEIYPVKNWKISAYADSYRFLWTRYTAATPSTGMDYLLQAEYKPRRDVSMNWRLKHEQSVRNQPDSNLALPFISRYQKSSLRYQLNFGAGDFVLKTLLEGNLYREDAGNYSCGFTALQDISYSFRKIPVKINTRFQIFDARDYENRLYTYENDILYAFSIPMYYGIGSRYYLNVKWEASKKLSVWLKAAQTVYADNREYTGTGNERSAGNRRSEIKMLLSYDF